MDDNDKVAVPLSTRIRLDVWRALRDYSAREGVAMTAVLDTALRRFLNLPTR